MNIIYSVKQNLQKFCDDSSIHGFHELYYSKSLIWKSIWLCALMLAFCVSFYQIQETVTNSIEQPTSTFIERFDGNIEYPPLTVCCSLWIHCIDWNKVSLAGFDKDTVIYGMSFLSRIILENPYNFTEAKAKFNKATKNKNVTLIMQFLAAVT